MNFKDKELRKEVEYLDGNMSWSIERMDKLQEKILKLYRHLGLEICEGGEIKSIKKVSKKK